MGHETISIRFCAWSGTGLVRAYADKNTKKHDKSLCVECIYLLVLDGATLASDVQQVLLKNGTKSILCGSQNFFETPQRFEVVWFLIIFSDL